MKSVLKIFLLILLPGLTLAQDEQGEESILLEALKNAPDDTIRMEINRKLGFYHQDSDGSKALVYHQAQLALAEKLNLKLWEADAHQQIAYCLTYLYRFPDAYENYMQALEIAGNPASSANGWGFSDFSYSKSAEDARWAIIGMVHFELFDFYNRTRNPEEAFKHTLQALAIGEKINNQKILSISNRDIGNYYLKTDKLDLALVYYQKALKHYQNSPYQKNIGSIYLQLGLYYTKKQDYDSAKICYRIGIEMTADPASVGLQGGIKRLLGGVYLTTGRLDSALLYTTEAKTIAETIDDLPSKASCFGQLAAIYEQKKEYSIAYNYLEKGKNIGDKLADEYIDRLMQFQNLDFDQKIRLQELEKESQLVKSRNRMYVMLTGLGIFLLVALMLYRNNLQKQKANKVLESTLTNLKAAQTQLIQSEKMASLGELTAGIAHEIQNPLNFVNNFSEVNSEMIEEVNQEIDKGNLGEAKAILKDLKENQEKINQHGKRADAIVKGMLQHSRTSSGQKEPTDINTLCDEYLRLAYHGLRARDKSFHATFETDFDDSLEKINLVPQDIGRVILNLVNNAFYEVNEKAKQQVPGYEPLVTVSTRKMNGKVEISIKDNADGIPETTREKIFQPFFTTKPTGQGTGLGLSLSYDIVKAHGGSLEVESKEGQGSKFIITLTGSND